MIYKSFTVKIFIFPNTQYEENVLHPGKSTSLVSLLVDRERIVFENKPQTIKRFSPHAHYKKKIKEKHLKPICLQVTDQNGESNKIE